MIYIPLTTTPIGWLILGLGGYALYKRGKRKGEEEAAALQIIAAPVQTKKQNTIEVKKATKDLKGGN